MAAPQTQRSSTPSCRRSRTMASSSGIGRARTTSRSRKRLRASGTIIDPVYGYYDIVHWNSIEPAGPNAVVASFRYLDAVYKISETTGNIIWKLGGSHTPQSLTVLGDPASQPFGGQHDARVLPDGTVSVFDNRYLLDQPPRVTRWRIDEQAHTATLIQQITDPAVHRTDAAAPPDCFPMEAGSWIGATTEPSAATSRTARPHSGSSSRVRISAIGRSRSHPVQLPCRTSVGR